MKQIWKYEFRNECTTKFKIPIASEVISAKSFNDHICLWVGVDIDAPQESRLYEVFLTGQEIPTGVEIKRLFIDTVIHKSSVYHIFERLDQRGK